MGSTGLVVAALVIKNNVTLEDPEMAFGYGSRELLGPGLTGLMLAAIVAANMSTCSNFMVNTGALFTQNIYKRHINPNSDDHRLLWVGRFSGLGLSLLGVLFALSIKNVLHAFLFTETTAAFMGIAFLGGIIWKRANRYGAAAGVLTAFFSYYLINFLNVGELMLVYKWEPAPFGLAMLFGFGMFWLGSILTKREDQDRIDSFFDQMRRKSDVIVGDGELKPLASESGEESLLLDLSGWMKRDRWTGFFQRYREDIGGFLLSWVFVGILILLAWGILQL